MVYRLNMKDPRSYFVAQRFQVHDKDLVLISNARANMILKMLNMIGVAINPIIVSKQLSQ